MITMEILGSGRRIDVKLTEIVKGTLFRDCLPKSILRQQWPTKVQIFLWPDSMVFVVVLKNVDLPNFTIGMDEKIYAIVCPECWFTKIDRNFAKSERMCSQCYQRKLRQQEIVQELPKLFEILQSWTGQVVAFGPIHEGLANGSGVLTAFKQVKSKETPFPIIQLTIDTIGTLEYDITGFEYDEQEVVNSFLSFRLDSEYHARELIGFHVPDFV